MNSTIATINSQLDTEISKLRSHLAELETQSAAKKAELNRVEDARAALVGKKSRTTPPQRKNSKPAPTTEKVGSLIKTILRQNRTLPEAELREAVAVQLVKDGFSKLGLTLRFKAAMDRLGASSVGRDRSQPVPAASKADAAKEGSQ